MQPSGPTSFARTGNGRYSRPSSDATRFLKPRKSSIASSNCPPAALISCSSSAASAPSTYWAICSKVGCVLSAGEEGHLSLTKQFGLQRKERGIGVQRSFDLPAWSWLAAQVVQARGRSSRTAFSPFQSSQCSSQFVTFGSDDASHHFRECAQCSAWRLGHLSGHHRGKDSLPVSQFVESSPVDYPPLVQNINLIGVSDGAQTVCDD